MAPPPFDGYEEDLLDDEVLQDEEEEWVELGDEGAPGFRAALFSSQAGLYARYRPNYPPHVRPGLALAPRCQPCPPVLACR